MNNGKRRAAIAGGAAGVLTIGGALTMVPAVGPLLAVGFLVVAVLLFSNWYRTSTPLHSSDAADLIGAPETYGRFTVHWIGDGSERNAEPEGRVPAAATH